VALPCREVGRRAALAADRLHPLQLKPALQDRFCLLRVQSIPSLAANGGFTAWPAFPPVAKTLLSAPDRP